MTMNSSHSAPGARKTRDPRCCLQLPEEWPSGASAWSSVTGTTATDQRSVRGATGRARRVSGAPGPVMVVPSVAYGSSRLAVHRLLDGGDVGGARVLDEVEHVLPHALLPAALEVVEAEH